MSILRSIIKKEAIHIVRDTRTMIITLAMPMVLLLLFGFAISTEVNKIRVVAVVDQHTDLTRDILERFRVNSYFDFLGITSSGEVEELLKNGKTDAAIFFKTDEGRLKTQIIVDGSNTITARPSTAYIQGVISGATSGATSNSTALTYTLYNPQMKSAYNFVPGIMGMIFILICAIMTSVSIVREKETGTMNLLLVSPVKPRTIIIGKLIPYFILSCMILTIMLLLSYTVLGLPASATIISVVLISLLYVVLSLSLGLLVSAIANSQLTALIASAVVLMIPVVMLSGMIFPIDNMPAILQGVSCIIPARWYIEAMRKLMIQQLEISYVARDILILSAMTIGLLVVAVKKFQSSTR